MTDYEIISPDPDQYRKLITSDILDFPGSVFYEPEFLIASASILNLDFRPALTLLSDKVTGISNYLIGDKAGVKIALIPKMFQYYGPVNLVDDPEIFNLLVEPLLRNKVDTCVFSLVPGLNYVIPPNWRVNNRVTFFFDTNSFEIMIGLCNRNARRQAFKAIRGGGGEFIETDSLPYDIYYQTFKRHNKKPFVDERTLVDWVDKLKNLGLAKTFIAVVNTKTVAFLTILYYGKFAYFWVGGSLPEYLKLGVNNFLVFKVGEYLHNNGIAHVDFIGGDIKEIAEFKKSFGSRPVKHIQVEKSFSPKGKLYRMLMKMKAKLNE